MIRDGLKALIADRAEWRVVGESADGLEAIQLLHKYEPDLLMVDLSMPKANGIRVIEEARRYSPETRILVLSAHAEEEFIFAALMAGANGYVIKDSENNELVRAIESVLGGNAYLSPSVATEVINGYVRSSSAPAEGSMSTLTPREKEVLQLIVEDRGSNQEIAEHLFISVKTAEKHKTNILRKLNAKNSAELVRRFKSMDVL